MNGMTRAHHIAAYTGTGSADVSHAVARLPLICAYFADECAAALEDPALKALAAARLAAFRSDLGALAGEMESASPAPLESVGTIRRTYVRWGFDEEVALERAQEAAAAARAMREAIPAFREIFDELAAAPPSPGDRRRRTPASRR